MKTQDISNLYFNPRWTAKLLHCFLSGAKEAGYQKVKFEIIYFALPFIYNEIVFNKLLKSNKRSSFESLFGSIELKNTLIGMDNCVNDYKKITNKGLIYLSSKIEMDISDYLEIKDYCHYNNEVDTVKDFFKVAFNLGSVLSKEHYINLFTKTDVILI